MDGAQCVGRGRGHRGRIAEGNIGRVAQIGRYQHPHPVPDGITETPRQHGGMSENGIFVVISRLGLAIRIGEDSHFATSELVCPARATTEILGPALPGPAAVTARTLQQFIEVDAANIRACRSDPSATDTSVPVQSKGAYLWA